MTALAAPPTYPTYRTRNLERANDIRLSRVALRHRIKEMPRYDAVRFSADLVLDLPDCLATMQVGEFVRLPKSMKRRTWNRWLGAIPVYEQKELGALTPRQAGRLASCMRAYAGGEL